jgi:PhzF family phenazine biosynthesis protein
MKQKIYQVDAFTDQVFSGNPAAVCPLAEWIPDELMQSIAMENNLAETAFFVREGDQHVIRWFTPKLEVDLCGHATLASAFILFSLENYPGNTIQFLSPRSGLLSVTRTGDLLTLNFPADYPVEIELPESLGAGFDIRPQATLKGKTDYLLVFENEKQIREMQPDFRQIAKSGARGVIITARGEEADFVSRFFAPQSGIDEDPVTGSAHTTLTPFWAEKLGKKELKAIQLSERKGHLHCKALGDRVKISGRARLYMEGMIHLE